MKAATTPMQRSRSARLLVIEGDGTLRHAERSQLLDFLEPGDLVIANDAATLPASLQGVHERTGGSVEVRLAGRMSLEADDVRSFTAVVFGEGDHRTRTEDRPAPPKLQAGDTLRLGPLVATVLETLGHGRLLRLRFEGPSDAVWAGIARHGKPVQYAYLERSLELWDVWTRVAALPVAFESPSAGFLLDWRLLSALASRGISFATLTHAAGLSSTGDPALDARLPLDEPYFLPEATVQAIAAAREQGGRIVAIGTTVVRALEHAARSSGGLCPGPGVCPGTGLATLRLAAGSQLQVVNALVSGTHEPGESHYELLRAFAGREVLDRMSAALEEMDYRSHEFGDSVLIVRQGIRPEELAGLPDVELQRWGSLHQVQPLV